MIAKKVTIQLGYFCMNIFHGDLSKSKTGHTVRCQINLADIENFGLSKPRN